jgi:hypothetical protein
LPVSIAIAGSLISRPPLTLRQASLFPFLIQELKLGTSILPGLVIA